MTTILDASSATQLWHDAERLLDSGLPDAAEAAYQRLVADPDLAPAAYLRLSLIASDRHHHRDAVDHALAACATRRREPELLKAIARRLAQLGEIHAALACALDPVIVQGTDRRLQAELGKLLANHYLPVAALQLLEQARAAGFRDPGLAYLAGLCRMYVGDAEGARAEFEAALAVVPTMAPALRALTRLGPPAAGEDRIGRIERMLELIGDDHERAPMLRYALFAEHDRRDETELAWTQLERGMQQRRAQVRYDAAAEQALFQFLLATTPGPGADEAAPAADGPRPVFIVGMPRSGTTLLERLLGNHPDVHDAGELHDFTHQLRWCCDLAGAPYLDLPLAERAEAIDFAELGRRYLDRTRWRARGRAVYTDKMPANFSNVSYIARALPQAKILHMVRGPMDTCFSNLKEWFGGIYPHSYDQLEMADHFRNYRQLMAHWRALYPGRILDVRYDELVADPEATMREVLEFCDLPAYEGIATVDRGGVVATASAMQVREPVHGRGLQQWKRYEQYLGPLKERLGALAY